jgi:hypothetical protein
MPALFLRGSLQRILTDSVQLAAAVANPDHVVFVDKSTSVVRGSWMYDVVVVVHGAASLVLRLFITYHLKWLLRVVFCLCQ